MQPQTHSSKHKNQRQRLPILIHTRRGTVHISAASANDPGQTPNKIYELCQCGATVTRNESRFGRVCYTDALRYFTSAAALLQHGDLCPQCGAPETFAAVYESQALYRAHAFHSTPESKAAIERATFRAATLVLGEEAALGLIAQEQAEVAAHRQHRARAQVIALPA